MTLVSPSFSLYFSNLQRKPMLSLLECMGFLTGCTGALPMAARLLCYSDNTNSVHGNLSGGLAVKVSDFPPGRQSVSR